MTWYAAKPDVRGLPSPPPRQGADELRVPLNRAKFEQFRNMNAVMAGLGLGMVLLFLPCLIISLYTILSSPVIDSGWVLIGFLSFWLVVFISLATVPAWQTASDQTEVLRRDLPALVIDRDGIVDNASNYVLGRIPWSQIESSSEATRYATESRQTFAGIAFVLKDKELLLQKKSKLLAMWMLRDDEIKKKRQVFIPQGRIEMPVEEVVKLANEIKEGKQL